MRLDANSPDLVKVTLSRRNLLTLLANLEGFPWWTNCTIYRRSDLSLPVLAVQAEPDDVHYAGRPAGRMAAEAEAWMEIVESASRSFGSATAPSTDQFQGRDVPPADVPLPGRGEVVEGPDAGGRPDLDPEAGPGGKGDAGLGSS